LKDRFPERIQVIDATQGPESMQRDALAILESHFPTLFREFS